LANELRTGLRSPRRHPFGWLHDASKDRKHIRCPSCGQVISVSSEQGQVRKRQPKPPPSTSTGQAVSMAPSSSSPHKLWYLDYAGTCTIPCAC
jgi:hypothetical protein